VISILALLQSRGWLVLISLFFVGLAIAAGLDAWRERLARNAASNVIEGYSIDSLNIANLRRRLEIADSSFWRRNTPRASKARTSRLPRGIQAIAALGMPQPSTSLLIR
jgi:hypothetical protein